MDSPSKQISYEILDPARENGREIITAYLSGGQKLATIFTTEWRD